MTTIKTPEEWPPEIQESYEPIRILGKGGFASVVLAREKNMTPSNGSKNQKVAIKVVGGMCRNDSEVKETIMYARREIQILKYIVHPNIVKLFDHWISDESSSDKKGKRANTNLKSDLTAAVLVLEYTKGPTVESLLKYGGALSTNFGRIVIAQAMDAIAYLHQHAVLHRDIKPDNLIVTGALSSDDFIWDNEGDGDDDDKSAIGVIPREPNWRALRSKYKVTLIDFGFARALTPEDVSAPCKEKKTDDSQIASYHRIYNDSHIYEKTEDDDDLGSSQNSTRSGSVRKRIRKGILDSSVHRMFSFRNRTQSDELSSSISHRMKRTMSALGNKNFAAPEIVNKVRPRYRPRSEPVIKKSEQALDKNTRVTETISTYVADYGLLVDSYSMGHTIRYMMTGVQPGISVEDAIQQQSGGCLYKTFSLCLGNAQSGENQTTRSVRYRLVADLPGQVWRLIGSLTQISEQDRLSIRKARWNVPWIADVLEMENPQAGENDEGVFHESKDYSISYLPFANSTAQKPVTCEEIDATVTTAPVDISSTIRDSIEKST